MLTDRELEVLAAELIGEFTGAIGKFRGQRQKVDDIILDAKIPQGLNFNFGGYELFDKILNYSRSREDIKGFEQRFKCIEQGLEDELQTGCFSDATRMLARSLAREKGLDVNLPPDEWFNENGETWDVEPPADFGRLCETIVQAMQYNYSVAAEIGLSRKNTLLQQSVAARIEAAKPKPKLSDLWQTYRRYKLAKGSWGANTERKNQDTFDETVKILGDKELADYTQDDSIIYLSVLEKNGNSAGTRSGKIATLSSIFRYALKTPESTDRWRVRGNPFTEMQAEDNIPVNEKKIPYTADDIHGLLTGLLAVRKLVEPHRFWVPLIALYKEYNNMNMRRSLSL